MLEKFPQILDLLLLDNTANKNIIWVTNSYKDKGYCFSDQIYLAIIGNNNLIVPRAKKNVVEKNKRSKDKTEVFTPSWMCNKQNNLIDFECFGRTKKCIYDLIEWPKENDNTAIDKIEKQLYKILKLDKNDIKVIEEFKLN